MRTKTSPTILERAKMAVPEFEKVMDKLSSQVSLKGQSESTLKNYTRRLAHKNNCFYCFNAIKEAVFFTNFVFYFPKHLPKNLRKPSISA